MPAQFVRFIPNRSGHDRLLHDPAGPYGQWLARTGNRAVNYAKQYANVDTGLMRSSIVFRLRVEGGTLVGELAAETNYARFVHDGTWFYVGNPFLTDGIRTALGQ
ncbi:minor capsid protein [Pseudanabaena phage Pam4]|nr:minor capsid protein [Pseudanabaena phage Pam4]